MINNTNREELLRLYREGKTDREIANITRLDVSQVSGWRHRNHLPLNPSRSTIISRDHRIMYERLYEQGYDDYTISRAVKVKKAAVTHWRERRGLPEVAK